MIFVQDVQVHYEYIDFHLVVPSHYDIETAHELCNRIEEDNEDVYIMQKY